MRRLFTVLAAAVLLLTACAPGEGDASAPTSSAGVEQSAQGTCTFTDSLGNTVELEQPPKRVAALLGSYAGPGCWPEERWWQSRRTPMTSGGWSSRRTP